MELYQTIGVLISLVLSALFSGTEIAFVSADKLHIELQSQKGKLPERLLARFIDKSSYFIAALLMGNTVTLVVYGIYMAEILDPLLLAYLPLSINNEFNILFIQTILSTIIVLITAEFLPKSIFLINPTRLLTFLSIPMSLLYYMLFPFVYLMVNFSKFVIINIFRLDYSEDRAVYNLVDLDKYVSNIAPNTNEASESPEIDPKIFSAALEFRDIKVRECMVPRTEIVAVEENNTLIKLRKAFEDSGHSKILVYQENIDAIIGYCHSLDLFKKPENIASIITPIISVPESMPAQELLAQFIAEHKSIALIFDEFGGTSGIVTIEDVIEEIFGEIQDEHDKEVWVEKKIDENNFILSARHEIDYLNDRYDWDLPEDEYDTLGGLILHLNEDIPKPNQVLHYSPFVFTILSIQDRARIDTVKVSLQKNKSKPKKRKSPLKVSRNS
ncbi:hemolysin family protein [uncultured Microscilla sp.]|uniref:hemolysin family protein n=1 Tax=uncultured Microscilla sp. TaxID=432653 RepID=UPI0026167378|nr:hemolysin family protein [uncultured Microscilla sp.]